MQKQKKFKKFIVSALIAGSLCVALPCSVSAATIPNSLSQDNADILISESVEYLEDGSSITTSVYKSPILSRAATYEQPGSKTITFKDSNGKILWKYTLSAIFVVNPGVSATCKSASGTPFIYDNSWSVVSNKPSRSGNKATGTITMQKKLLGTVVQTTTQTVNLTCDANGNLS